MMSATRRDQAATLASYIEAMSDAKGHWTYQSYVDYVHTIAKIPLSRQQFAWQMKMLDRELASLAKHGIEAKLCKTIEIDRREWSESYGRRTFTVYSISTEVLDNGQNRL